MRMIFPSGVVWKGDPADNAVYLTFDDGPDPEVTQFVMDELDRYGYKATFFCIGDNVALYPETFEKVKAVGHHVGNHTMHHSNGWKTPAKEFVDEILEADKLIHANLFRPPYGKITASQTSLLKKKMARQDDFKIIMWSVIAGDWDDKADGNLCYERIVKYTRPGSIIVFHDSQKAFPRLKVALPKTLAWLKEQGFNPALIA